MYGLIYLLYYPRGEGEEERLQVYSEEAHNYEEKLATCI